MSEELMVPFVPEPQPMVVMARTPDEMQRAQVAMIEWAGLKVAQMAGEAAELRGELEHAKKHGWRTTGLRAALTRAEKRQRFYEKARLALEAGYALVPNFPVDVFAVRTLRTEPRPVETSYQNAIPREPAQALPPGEGAYKDPWPTADSYTESKVDGQGKEKKETRWFPVELRDVEFPLQLAKIEVMDATQLAMSKKIFDEIGSLPGRRQSRGRGDPIVVGRIVNKEGYNEHVLTFMIAWFMTLDML